MQTAPPGPSTPKGPQPYVLAVILTMILTGCINGNIPPDPPDPHAFSLVMSDLDAQDLSNASVKIVQSEPGWQVVRWIAGPDDWNVARNENGYEAGVVLIGVARPLADAPGHLMHAWRWDDGDPQIRFTAFDEPTPIVIGGIRGCTGACDTPVDSTFEFVFLLGARSGPVELLLGTHESDVWPTQKTLDEIPTRERISVRPDAIGDHVISGSYHSHFTHEHEEETLVGDLEAVRSILLEGPGGVRVQDDLEIQGAKTMPRAGIAGISASLREATGATRWDLTWELGDQTEIREENVVWGPVVIGENVYHAYGTTGPGDARIAFAQHFTGATPSQDLDPAPVVLTHRAHIEWGYADLDLAALTGWDLPKAEPTLDPYRGYVSYGPSRPDPITHRVVEGLGRVASPDSRAG